jgi:L-aminopeptidase/D-esterase-like protein
VAEDVAFTHMTAITDIPGITVGHAQDDDALTGCTVVLCPAGAIGGIDVRGGAAGTRQVDALGVLHLVPHVHAVLLTGGAAFGLDATGGVLRWLEERGYGFEMRVTRVPIVPSAVLFDLALGRGDVRPDAAMGYAACEAATNAPPAEGSVGVGTGATVGKALGLAQAMRGGIGAAACDLGDGVLVGALVAVNAFGDVVDPAGGQVVAGARQPGTHEFAGAQEALRARLRGRPGPPPEPGERFGNTVIGVVATNATLTKGQATRVAQMAHDGLARAVRPAHTTVDGDTLFALATGGAGECDVNVIGAFAADRVAEAIVRAVRHATAAGGIPAWRDLHGD